MRLFEITYDIFPEGILCERKVVSMYLKLISNEHRSTDLEHHVSYIDVKDVLKKIMSVRNNDVGTLARFTLPAPLAQLEIHFDKYSDYVSFQVFIKKNAGTERASKKKSHLTQISEKLNEPFTHFPDGNQLLVMGKGKKDMGRITEHDNSKFNIVVSIGARFDLIKDNEYGTEENIVIFKKWLDRFFLPLMDRAVHSLYDAYDVQDPPFMLLLDQGE